MRDFIETRHIWYAPFLLIGGLLAFIQPAAGPLLLFIPLAFNWRYHCRRGPLLIVKLYVAGFWLFFATGFVVVMFTGYDPAITGVIFCMAYAIVAAEATMKMGEEGNKDAEA